MKENPVAIYRVKRQSGGVGFFAGIELRQVAESGDDSVDVSPLAFEWLKSDYGPDAYEWKECDDWREAAIAGAKYALSNIPRVAGASISIERIEAHPCHTTSDAIAMASCFATSDLFSAPMRCEPFFEGAKIVFPGGIAFPT